MTTGADSRARRPRAAASGRGSAAWAVVLVFFGIALFQYIYFPGRQHETLSQALREKAAAIAELAAYNVRPGVEFDDAQLVAEVFNGAARDPDLQYIAVFKEDGSLFGAVNPKGVALLDLPKHGPSTATT